MTMSDVVTLAWAGGAGVLLGGFFFGGLWWTVRRGLSSERGAPLFLVSLLLRTGLSLAGFLFVADGRWDRMAACLIGFVGARFIVTRLSPAPVAIRSSSASQVGHAP
jgi:F1F0 ATPase subunit 2